jgi:hypothetical protein
MKSTLVLLMFTFGALQANAIEGREYYTEAMQSTLNLALDIHQTDSFKIEKRGLTPAGETCVLNIEQQLEQFGNVANYSVTLKNLTSEKSATVSFGKMLAGASSSPHPDLKYVAQFDENLPEVFIKLIQKDDSKSILGLFENGVETIQVSNDNNQTRITAAASPAGLTSLWHATEIVCNIEKSAESIHVKQAALSK